MTDYERTGPWAQTGTLKCPHTGTIHLCLWLLCVFLWSCFHDPPVSMKLNLSPFPYFFSAGSQLADVFFYVTALHRRPIVLKISQAAPPPDFHGTQSKQTLVCSGFLKMPLTFSALGLTPIVPGPCCYVGLFLGYLASEDQKPLTKWVICLWSHL